MKRNQFVPPILVIFMILCMTSCTKVKDAWDSLTGKTEAVQVDNDTTKVVTYTAYDVVAQRRAEIEFMKMDSIYYSIPEPILIAIVDEIGIDVTREDIVKTYQINKQRYDGLLTGLKNIKHFMPDTIPNQAPVDINSKIIPLKKDSVK